jgi:hypothetical protein
MSKETKTTIKQPKSVEVKLLVPYAIIVVMAVAFAGLVTGWTLRSNQVTEVKSQVTAEVETILSLKDKSQ